MWLSDESVCEVKKEPDHAGWVRCFFPREGVTHNEEVVRRTAIVISAPSGEWYEFRVEGDERVSDFQPVKTEADAEWFQDPSHSPFHYRGKR